MMLLTPPAVPDARWNAASDAPLDRTVLDEITRRRIETARRLLVETDLDIGGVAKRSGFSDARRITVVFRERLGRHPE